MTDYDFFEFDRDGSVGNPDIKPREVGTTGKPVKEGHYESLDADHMGLTDQGSAPAAETNTRVLWADDTDGEIKVTNPDGTSSRFGGVSGQDDPLAVPSTATSNTDSVAVGPNAAGNGIQNVVIGDSATGGTNGNDVAIGYKAGQNVRRDNVIIGSFATSGGVESVAIGKSSNGSDNSVVIGYSASATGGGAVAIGKHTSVATAGVGRIGVNQLAFGGVQDTLADADLNNSELTLDIDETNSQFIIRAKTSGGTVVTGTVGYV